MLKRLPFRLHILATCAMLSLAGCAEIPTSGPSTAHINDINKKIKDSGIQIVDVNEVIAEKLLSERQQGNFEQTLGSDTEFQQQLGIGDVVAISIWEAPPATLFGASTGEGGSLSSGNHVTTLPTQMIDANGKITIPFIGEVQASGLTPTQLDESIQRRLKGKANLPQVMVQLAQNSTSYVTVLGDVSRSARVQLTPKGERVLDVIASAGGVKEPINKITVQITRGDKVETLPLQTVIDSPRQNVPLHANDVVTAVFQPYSFTTLGALGQTHEVSFEVQGITLAQAMSRSGGLQDARSDARGVYIFRFEDPKALPWTNFPVKARADGRIPVIYRFNLQDPRSLFVAQTFMLNDKDMLYVSNAPVADMEKLINIIFSMVYPVAEIGILAR